MADIAEVTNDTKARSPSNMEVCNEKIVFVQPMNPLPLITSQERHWHKYARELQEIPYLGLYS